MGLGIMTFTEPYVIAQALGLLSCRSMWVMLTRSCGNRRMSVCVYIQDSLSASKALCSVHSRFSLDISDMGSSSSLPDRAKFTDTFRAMETPLRKQHDEHCINGTFEAFSAGMELLVVNCMLEALRLGLNRGQGGRNP